MLLTRKQFLDLTGRGALGAAACSAFGLNGRAEAHGAVEAASPSKGAERAFSFEATAAALGGRITRPFNEVIENQAASILSPVGGYDSARVEKFRYREIVSFDAGYTQVIGSEHRGSDGRKYYETLASAVLEGLNILDMVTADRVVARLTSSQPADSDPAGEIPMLPLGSYFVNLRIAGVRIDDYVQPHADLLEAATMSAINERCRAKGHLFVHGGDGKSAASRGEGRLRTSLLHEEKWKTVQIPGAKTYPGSRIEIPDFGQIFLGEFEATPGSREIRMVRVAMGSPEAGELVAGYVQGNGSTY